MSLVPVILVLFLLSYLQTFIVMHSLIILYMHVMHSNYTGPPPTLCEWKKNRKGQSAVCPSCRRHFWVLFFPSSFDLAFPPIFNFIMLKFYASMLNFNVIFIYWHYFTIANRLEYIHFLVRRTFLKLLCANWCFTKETQSGNLHALACKQVKGWTQANVFHNLLQLENRLFATG